MALFKKDRGNAENQSAKDPQAGGDEFPERNQGSSSRENKGMAGTGAAEQRSELGGGRETALLGKGTRISGKLSFEGMARIEGEGQVVFRYVDNPNGSVHDIAGIQNARGNVLGMMPHPERLADQALGGTDGRPMFESVLATLS